MITAKEAKIISDKINGNDFSSLSLITDIERTINQDANRGRYQIQWASKIPFESEVSKYFKTQGFDVRVITESSESNTLYKLIISW